MPTPHQEVATQNRTTAFFPDEKTPESSLTSEDLRAMENESKETDTLSPVVMADLVDKMTTYKREETLEMLRDMVDESTGKVKANKIIALIRYVPPRKGKHLPTGESYKQRKARKLTDELLQKEVMRKLQKWNGACRLRTGKRLLV